MPKVTYIGDEAEITEGGITFKRGEAVNVPDSHPRLNKLLNNPTFSSDTEAGEPQPEPGPLDGSIADLEEHLAGVDDSAEIDRLIAAETAGKSRKGALDALEARKAELA